MAIPHFISSSTYLYRKAQINPAFITSEFTLFSPFSTLFVVAVYKVCWSSILFMTSIHQFTNPWIFLSKHFFFWIEIIQPFLNLIGASKCISHRVSVQEVKSLAGHFACLCRELWSKNKKKILIFFKKKREILLHF